MPPHEKKRIPKRLGKELLLEAVWKLRFRSAADTVKNQASGVIVIRWRGSNVQRSEIPKALNGFWQVETRDQLAAAQDVTEVLNIDSVRGTWPQDDLNDGFDVALRRWRGQDVERHR